MQIQAMREQLRAEGAGPRHEAMLLRHWLGGGPVGAPRRMRKATMPRRLEAALPALQAGWEAIATLRSAHPAEDGAERLLLALADGETIETVLLPDGGLCVSTQVGCAVGCGFCMTGQGGLRRQLGSAEIASQLALARRRRPVRKLVLMGMGEPAHNLDAVLDAVTMIGTEGGIGHKSMMLSTVGDERLFERLAAAAVQPALAISLHSTDAARRAMLLPRAPRFEPAVLVAHGLAWSRAARHPLMLQWTLMDGLNDGDDEVEGLARLLAGERAVLNLIPFNAVDGVPWRRPARARAEDMADRLRARGVMVTLRRSAGQDVDGACGQLRARVAGESMMPPQPRAVRPGTPGS